MQGEKESMAGALEGLVLCWISRGNKEQKAEEKMEVFRSSDELDGIEMQMQQPTSPSTVEVTPFLSSVGKAPYPPLSQVQQ